MKALLNSFESFSVPAGVSTYVQLGTPIITEMKWVQQTQTFDVTMDRPGTLFFFLSQSTAIAPTQPQVQAMNLSSVIAFPAGTNIPLATVTAGASLVPGTIYDLYYYAQDSLGNNAGQALFILTFTYEPVQTFQFISTPTPPVSAGGTPFNITIESLLNGVASNYPSPLVLSSVAGQYEFSLTNGSYVTSLTIASIPSTNQLIWAKALHSGTDTITLTDNTYIMGTVASLSLAAA